MELSPLEKLIWLLSAYRSEGILATQLAKLLYLIDLRFAQERGRTLTGAEWRYHHFGPYPFEIETAVQALEEKELLFRRESTTIDGERTYHVHYARAGLDYRSLFDSNDQTLVFEQLVRYGNLDADTLTEVAYNTVPMLRADKGEVLDMTREHRKEQALKKAGVPIDRLKKIAKTIDRSTRGTPEERAAHSREVMEDMSAARRRATSERLKDE